MRPEAGDGHDFESELRQGVGREWAEEAAEDERLTEKLRERRSDLGTRMLSFVAVGQRVRAETGSQSFTGTVVFAGTDYAVLDRGDDEVALRLADAIWTMEPGGPGVKSQTDPPMSFRANLAGIEVSGEIVRVLVEEGRTLIGAIATVATDHVVMDDDGHEVLIPLEAVTAVVRSRPR